MLITRGSPFAGAASRQALSRCPCAALSAAWPARLGHRARLPLRVRGWSARSARRPGFTRSHHAPRCSREISGLPGSRYDLPCSLSARPSAPTSSTAVTSHITCGVVTSGTQQIFSSQATRPPRRARYPLVKGVSRPHETRRELCGPATRSSPNRAPSAWITTPFRKFRIGRWPQQEIGPVDRSSQAVSLLMSPSFCLKVQVGGGFQEIKKLDQWTGPALFGAPCWLHRVGVHLLEEGRWRDSLLAHQRLPLLVVRGVQQYGDRGALRHLQEVRLCL